MSLLAGFDLVTEISNEALLKLLQANLVVGGQAAVPPFEITLPFAAGGVNCTAHIIVHDLALDLNQDDTITITVMFHKAAVVAAPPLSLHLCPLDGNFTIRAPLLLADGSPGEKRLALNLGAAAVQLQLSQGSQNLITNALAGTPLNLALLTNLALQAITTYVHNLTPNGQLTFPLSFKVTPGVDGSLTPLQFEHLEVHCIENPQRSQQALGLFGTLLAARHGLGNHPLKTATAITAGHSVCLSLSPEAFHALVFCPNVVHALNAPNVGSLPGTCGGAGGYGAQGATLTSLADSFAPGHINIDGSIEKSGFCYEAHGSFHGEMTFTINGGKLVPQVALADPNVDVDIPWYCYLASFGILDIIGPIIVAIIDHVADDIAKKMAADILKNALGKGLPGVTVADFGNLFFKDVTVSPEGLTLKGNADVDLPYPQQPSLKLAGKTTILKQQDTSQGVFHPDHGVPCALKEDYPYTERAVWQLADWEAQPTLLATPLDLQWFIEGIPLTGASGTITVPDIDTRYTLPLPGGAKVTQAVHIAYTITENRVKLTNDPKEGNFYLTLEVKATDCTGQQFHEYAYPGFEGQQVDCGYFNDLEECLREWWNQMKAKIQQYAGFRVVPPWEKVNYPRPDDFRDFLIAVATCGLPEADVLLTYAMMIHAASCHRILASPELSRVGLIRR